MRRPFILFISILLLCAVSATPLEKRQGLLDPIASFFSSALDLDPSPTSTADTSDDDETTATATPTSDSRADDDDDDDDDDKKESSTTILLGSAVSATRTTSESTTSNPSRTASRTSTTETTAPASTTTSVSSQTTSMPTGQANGTEESQQISQAGSGSSISTAGVVVAIIMSIAVAVVAFVLVWKFYPPVVRWRERREYEKMKERSYRPALDGPFLQQEKGLGLGDVHMLRPLSFLMLAKPKPKQQIKRKPVPTANQHGAVGNQARQGPSPALTPNVEKGLPSLPEKAHL